MKDFIKFNSTIGNLKHLPRSGWVKRGVPNPETVASHSWRVAVMILEFTDEIRAMGADVNKAVKMALYHDLGESIIGDLIPGEHKHADISREEKRVKESNAVKALASESGMNEIYGLWQEIEERQTIEAVIVKDFDVIDMLLQAFEYMQKYPTVTGLSDFMQNNESDVKTDLGKRLVAEIKSRQKNLPVGPDASEMSDGTSGAMAGMRDAAEKIIAFMDIVEKLCHIKRYTLMQDGRQETDSDHIMKLAFLVMMISPYINRPHDAQKMLEMALVHDLVEADAGDVPQPDQIKNPAIKIDKAISERAAIKKYHGMLPEPLGQKIYDLFMEFEEKKTFESRLVDALDKFDGNMQCNKENHGARHYAKIGHPVLDRMLENKFSKSLDGEEIIAHIENTLAKISQNNIEYCKKKGLIQPI